MEISSRLSGLMNFYHREAQKCARAKAFHAAAVMEVAALEAGLMAMCFLYPEEVKKTTVYAKKHFRRKQNRALEFSLFQLINIADEIAWFPSKRITWGGEKDTLAGFSHEIRKMRNRVHPGEWARERPVPLKFTKKVYEIIYEVNEVAISWLLHRVEKSLLSVMERARKKGSKTAKKSKS